MKKVISFVTITALLALILGVFLPYIKQAGDWRFEPHPRKAEARLAGQRLKILGDEVLTITSKTTPVQFNSGVSVSAVNVFVLFEGQDLRWRAYGTATQDQGGLFTEYDRFWMEEEEIPSSNFILERGAAATGATAYAIFYGRP